MKKMLFDAPIFNKGLNMTVRRGDRWFDSDQQVIQICNLNSDVLFETWVESTWLMPFSAIPEKWLRYEHDPSCRTRDGLLADLQEIYEGFDPEETVTVVFFKAKEIENA